MEQMAAYYKERAPIYDAVYAYPERQQDLRFLENHIPQILSGRRVLEVAAGTGYWSQFLSQTAKSLLVTDAEQATLDELAKRDNVEGVERRLLDAYHLDRLVDEGRRFGGAFAGLWWSHVPKQRVKEFLVSLHQCLKPGAVVVLLDNSAVQLEQFPITETDEWGNTYQTRELPSGNTHKVLKNFPSLEELKSMTEEFGEFQNYIDLENFWLFQYVHR